MTHYTSQDISMAKRFLSHLSQDEEPIFAFQIFNDRKQSRTSVAPRVLCGTLDEFTNEFIQLQEQGAGIFVTINQTDGKGRKTENITKVRAVFVDLDGSPLEPIFSAALSPHIIVESSPGRFHAYWLVEGIELQHFSLIQKKLISLFHGDSQVHDLARVMRLPGFFHQKQGPFLTRILQESGEQPFSLEKFFRAFDISITAKSEKNEQRNQNPFLTALAKHNMLIKQQSHPLGCWTIRCPWTHLHSIEDFGTKYYEPNTNGYPHHGFKCFHKHCENRTIHDLAVHLGLTALFESLEPIPLYRKIEEAEAYPFDALGPILGPAAKALHRVIRAPDAICAQSVLAATSLAAQPFANIVIDGRDIPLSCFFITVAESGDRKSATDKIALKPIYGWQKMHSDSYRSEVPQYNAQKQAWEMRKKTWMQENSNDKTLIFEELPPTPPLFPLILVEEPTYEGIVKYLAEGQPSIGLFSDEGGRFFGGYAMSRDNVLKTVAGLSSLWDGKAITRMRAGDGNMLLYGRRFALHLMIQEGVLQGLMQQNLVEVQGFLPRCLITFPASMVGQRPYMEEDVTKDPAIADYWKAIVNLLDRPFPVKEAPAPQNELLPSSIALSDDAKKIWIAFHDRIDKATAVGQSYHPIRRFASKAAEHVLRIAGSLALVENPETEIITQPYIERAAILIDYYLAERSRIQGYVTISAELLEAASLLNWCWERGKTQILLTECYQLGPASIRTAERARKTMSILVSHGWATPYLMRLSMAKNARKHGRSSRVSTNSANLLISSSS